MVLSNLQKAVGVNAVANATADNTEMADMTCIFVEGLGPTHTSFIENSIGAGAHLSGLNQLFSGYSILGELVVGPVFKLPRPYNRSGASGQAQTWTAGPSNSVVQSALEFAGIGHLFLVFWCAKKEPPDHFRPPVIWWHMGQMHHNLAQFVDHGRLLNLFFGSSQTDDWLPRYGHFKFCLTCLDMACKLCVNSVKLTVF